MTEDQEAEKELLEIFIAAGDDGITKEKIVGKSVHGITNERLSGLLANNVAFDKIFERNLINNADHYYIRDKEAAKKRLEILQDKFNQKEDDRETKRLSKEASTTSIEVGKATKTNIRTQKILGLSTLTLAALVGLIQFCNYRLTMKTLQEKKEQQEQLDKLQSKVSKQGNKLDSLSSQVHTLKKKSDSILKSVQTLESPPKRETVNK